MKGRTHLFQLNVNNQPTVSARGPQNTSGPAISFAPKIDGTHSQHQREREIDELDRLLPDEDFFG